MASARLRDYSRLMKAEDPMQILPGIESSVEDLVQVAPNDDARADVLNMFAFHNFSHDRGVEASNQFQRAFDYSGDVNALKNALVAGKAQQENGEFQQLQSRALSLADGLEDSPERAELLDALCALTGDQGDWETASRLGTDSLAVKDRLVMRAPRDGAVTLRDRKRPVFDFNRPERNIISFSLFGANPRYLNMAIENMRALRHVYPGWTARFHVDRSVPMDFVGELARRGAQVQMADSLSDPQTLSGTFWRFAVAEDASVDFFLVRDVDAVINVREKVAVDEWLASDRDFHVMRDFHTHSELMLAGMWGGIGCRIGGMAMAITRYLAQARRSLGTANHDQAFLRTRIWPLIREEVLEHDSVFQSPLGTQHAFPELGQMHPVRHVGQDMNVFLQPPAAVANSAA